MTASMAFPLPLMLLTLAQVVIGSALIFALIPALIFPPLSVDPADQWVARAGLMLAWMMLVAYLLAAVHLFSAVALLALLALTGWFLRHRAPSRYILSGGHQASASFYDALSQAFNWRKKVREKAQGVDRLTRRWSSADPMAYVWTAAVFVVLGVAAWMRFAPNWQHAGLFFSDAYETVQWVKDIDASILFPNGIYPMGYYLVVAGMQTLMHANAIVFIKFFGAFVGTLLTASVMWSTYRFCGRVVPALAAGAVYGLMPHLLPYDGARQLAAEGQELGNMLVLPVAWMVFQSWVTKKRGYVIAATALLTIVGLTHPVAILNAALAAIAATFGAWVVTGVAGRILKPYLWMVPLGAAIAVTPLAIAYGFGVPLLTSGVTFLTASGGAASAVIYPSVAPMVWVALASIFALFVTKLLWYDDLWEMGLPAVALFILAFAEGIVQLPRIGIDSAVLTTRAGEFLALAEAFSIGLGAAGVQEAAERLGVPRSAAAGSFLALTVAATALMLKGAIPRPFHGYTMSSDTFVAEFVHIDETHPRFSWDAVANGAYALSLNQGYQYDPSYWADHTSPLTRWPKFHFAGRQSYSASQRYIFFFVPTRVTVPKGLSDRAQLLAQDQRQQHVLKNWIHRWTRFHGPMPVYFKNRQLTVYWLKNGKNPL